MCFRHKPGFCTFGVWRGPGDDAAHEAAVEQDFLGEAMVFTDVLHVLPPLVPFSWCTHGCSLSTVKHSVQLFASNVQRWDFIWKDFKEPSTSMKPDPKTAQLQNCNKQFDS